jgi:hypothetical protein
MDSRGLLRRCAGTARAQGQERTEYGSTGEVARHD